MGHHQISIATTKVALPAGWESVRAAVTAFGLMLALLMESSGSALTAERKDLADPVSIDRSGSLQNPAWSPSGDALLVTNFRRGYNRGPADLLVVDLKTGDVRTLVATGGDNINLPGSAWNAATDRIIFSSAEEEHDEIFSVDASAPDSLEQLTRRRGQMAFEPSFAPEGQRFVFESHTAEQDDNGVLMIGATDRRAPEALTDRKADCRQPNWSPDGNIIVYQTLDRGRWRLKLFDLRDRTHHWLSDWPGEMTDASFSPDGKWIVFSGESSDMNRANLFLVPVTGGAPRRLTRSSDYDGAPSWSPHGDLVAFETIARRGVGRRNASIMIVKVPPELLSSDTP